MASFPQSLLRPSSSCDLEKRIPVASIARAWREMGFDPTPELAGVESIGLWRCRESQLQFYSPAPIGSEQLYAFLDQQGWYYAPDKWEFTRAAEFLKAQACRSVLEVGCGSGWFLKIAGNIGLRAQGIDLNSAAVAQAKAGGLDASTSTMAELISTGERYGAACAFQVLEHVAHPADFIAELVELVEPGGYVIFCTPDGDGWLGQRLQPLDMPPHHVTRWGRAAFAYLPRLFPLDVVALVSEPLAASHYGAWAAALVDPDPAGSEPPLSMPRRLSVGKRLLVAVLRLLQQLLPASPAQGQSLIAIYRRR